MKNLYNEFEKKKEFETYLKKENRSDVTLDYSLWIDWFVYWEKIDWDAVAKRAKEERKKYSTLRIPDEKILHAPLWR